MSSTTWRPWALGGRPAAAGPQHSQSHRLGAKRTRWLCARPVGSGGSPPGTSRAQVLLGLLLSLVAALACVKQQQTTCNKADLSGCVIDDVDVVDNPTIDDDEIEERIATAESQHFVNGAFEKVPIFSVWDRLTVDYEYFDRFVLERDLARIERLYRARGFYEAHARAGRVTRLANGQLRVEIAVTEGPPVTVGRVDLAWKDWALPLAAQVTKPVTDAKNGMPVGERFEEAKYEETKRAILREMTDRGFAYASVQGHVKVDLTLRQAAILYTIELGPKCTFGPVTFEGLGEIPERPVRDALGFEQGDPFSTSALESGEYAMADFGVFGSIDVAPKLSAPGTPRQSVVPIVITVQPAALRAVKAGVGAEVGSRVETHLVLGWENRNLFGGLRRFSAEAKPGLVLYPTRLQTVFDEAPQRVLPELKLNAEFRQPIPWDTRTSLILRGAFRLYQQIDPRSIDEYRPRTCENGVLDPGEDGRSGIVGPFTYDSVDRGGGCRPVLSPTLTGEEVPILGYREYIGSTGLLRRFWNSQVELGFYANLQLDDPFSYSDIPPPKAYQAVIIPFLEATTWLDLRRNAAGKPDRLNPNYGVFIADDVQVAAPRGTEEDTTFKGDLRLRPEFRGYVPLSRKVTLAVRFVGGVLLAQGYGDVMSGDQKNPTARSQPEERAIARDAQLLQFRGFFSGGPYSNRGYAQNAISPHAFICTDAIRECQPEKVYQLVSTGGVSIWEASAEVRVPIVGELGMAFFVDSSDVTRELTFRLTRPHVSTGFGLRYETPVGPLRADLGFRVPCLQVLDASGVYGVGACHNLAFRDLDVANPNTPGVLEEAPQDTFLGTKAPLQVNIAIGEAF